MGVEMTLAHPRRGARGEPVLERSAPRCQTPRYRDTSLRVHEVRAVFDRSTPGARHLVTAAPPVPDTSLRTPRYASLPTPRYRVTGPRHPA